MQTSKTLIALLLLTVSGGVSAEGTQVDYNGQRVSLEANKQPINTPKNDRAVAQIPAGHHFVVPGSFTVAVAAQNSPPLTVFSDDNKSCWVARWILPVWLPTASA